MKKGLLVILLALFNSVLSQKKPPIKIKKPLPIEDVRLSSTFPRRIAKFVNFVNKKANLNPTIRANEVKQVYGTKYKNGNMTLCFIYKNNKIKVFTYSKAEATGSKK